MQRAAAVPPGVISLLRGMTLALIFSASIYGQQPRPTEREQIGEVLGQPVYRDAIRGGKEFRLRDELHRLFAAPVVEQYRQQHKAELEPTEAAINAATAFFDRKHYERIRQHEPKLREQLKAVEENLGRSDLSKEQKRQFEAERQKLQWQLDPPGRPFAIFILNNWMFQKHLYDRYGGGRILWQQAGLEAFDAYRNWLEARERQGDFKITDGQLRSTFYEYWTTMKHGAFLTDDKERIRSEFLEPEWLPKVVRPRVGLVQDGARAGELLTLEGIDFNWCPAGSFTMGSPESEAGHRPDEAQCRVTFTRGYWMSKFETTQSQWQRIVGSFPDKKPGDDFGLGEDYPVYWVSYVDAQQFCQRATARLRQLTLLPPDWEVRLPTEAQWEYACRAQTTTATAFGDELSVEEANIQPDPSHAGATAKVANRSVPVGSYPANAWGLHDMHGNVFEWCRDWYHARLPGGSDPDLSAVRGQANRDGSYSRVRRGGAWTDQAVFCRSALRLRYEPERNSDHIGFRVIIEQTR